MHKDDTKACFLDHLGPYAMDGDALEQIVGGIQAGMIEARDRDDEEPELNVRNGVAVIPLHGAIMKKRSKFGGASTIDARQLVRMAVEDPQVKAIVIDSNSPGGPIAGVDELYREIKSADKVKPVHGHVTDLAASAGYWPLAACRRITANRTATVGSIGAFAVVVDASGAMKRDGVKVLRLASGDLKGAGSFGTAITKEQVANLQSRVDKAAGIFFDAVRAGRKVSEDDWKEISRGGAYLADDAVKLGLVDEVDDLENVIAGLATKEDRRMRFGGMRLAQAGLTAEMAASEKNPENTVDGDPATLAQSAVLAGDSISEAEMSEIEELKAKLEKAEKEKADLAAKLNDAPKGATASVLTDEQREALIDDQVKAEVAKRSLVTAKKTAAAELFAEFKDTGLTEKMAEGFFASCTTVEAVEGEKFIKQKTLAGLKGMNAQHAVPTMANTGEKAAAFRSLVAAKKKENPHNFVEAMRAAKKENPDGYVAYMAEANGGVNVVGLKFGRVSA